MPVAACSSSSSAAHRSSALAAAGLLALATMAGLDSLDNLTDADRKHLAPFLHQGATSARSTALQYVKSDPVSKKDPQGLPPTRLYEWPGSPLRVGGGL